MKNIRDAFTLPRVSTVVSLALASAALVMLSLIPAFASTSQQLIFQDRFGTGHGIFDGIRTRFGFWIWCQAVSSNSYGTECQGALYFYQLGIEGGVNGMVNSFTQSGNTVSFKVTVSSTPDHGVSNCAFSFAGAISEGPTNTVGLSCASPSGSSSDSGVAITLS